MKTLLALTLGLACIFLIGATSAGPDFTTDARCKAYTIAGTDAASNLLDICTSSSAPDQDGIDNQTIQGNVDCNSTELPAFLDSSRRSCFFDGFQDGLNISSATMGDASGILGWVRVATAVDGFVNQRSSGQVGANSIFRNCGSGLMRHNTKFNGTAVDGVACSAAYINNWHFVGRGWSGLNGGAGRNYTSVTSASNTLLDNSATVGGDYGSISTAHQLGRRAQTGLDLETHMVEMLQIDGDVTACEACSICRCNAGNNYWRTNGLTGWLGDSYDMCNQCAFCTDPGELQTHCGRPRRQM